MVPAFSVLLPLVVTAVAACSFIRHPARGLEPALPGAPAPYRIAPGDHLRIRYPYAPRLDEELPVRTDGRVVLPIGGEIRAAGCTIEEFSHAVTTRAHEVLDRPVVAVEVTEPRGSGISVGGEVRTPQRLDLRQAGTVAEAVHAAGGILFSGDADTVVLLRRPAGQSARAWRVALGDDTGGLDLPFPLVAHDVVFVPKTRVARLYLAFDQYVLRLLPFPTTFGVFFAVNEAPPGEAVTTVPVGVAVPGGP